MLANSGLIPQNTGKTSALGSQRCRESEYSELGHKKAPAAKTIYHNDIQMTSSKFCEVNYNYQKVVATNCHNVIINGCWPGGGVMSQFG
jgi:hypothetical protein